ncbi:MAG: tRNA uracil 4-sulfurtransferase ThiI [Methanothrix sp.]|nr:tRNA uracil 4-sulfurtransferase ThiI [Methanothrix sp.]
MISQDVVLVRYGEIALKDSWTRRGWEHLLVGNLSYDLRRAGIEHRIRRGGGRVFINTKDPHASEVASRVFGVVSTSPARSVPPDLKEISAAAVEVAASLRPATFAIRPRRSGVSITSEEIGRAVGEAVRLGTGASVDLESPQLEIFVEARREAAYIFTEVVRGVGGLPLGSQGQMVALISGGIDSSVAAWMMMRRGCPVSLLHFDARPYADSVEASMRSAEVLARWTSGRSISLITVPIASGIEKIASRHPRATCVLCRRLMYRIASQVMVRQRALGIVTGYSMGQVASQTAWNILAEQAGIDAPIYHPLIAMDKSWIMEMARKIGTYEVTEETLSCTAVPRKPMTRARREEILAMEQELGLQEMAEALAGQMSEKRVPCS